MLQIFTDLSLLPETIKSSPDVKTMDFIPFECPSRVETRVPVIKSHTFIVESLLPETKYIPFAVRAIDLTDPECPDRVLTTSPLFRSHILIVLSLLADTINLLSGLIVRDLIGD